MKRGKKLTAPQILTLNNPEARDRDLFMTDVSFLETQGVILDFPYKMSRRRIIILLLIQFVTRSGFFSQQLIKAGRQLRLQS